MRHWVCLIALLGTACSDRAPKEPAAAPASETTTPEAPPQTSPPPEEVAEKVTEEVAQEVDVTRVPDAETVERLRAKMKRPPAEKVLTVDAPTLDLSCEVAADCAIKNVGNCCGYYPRCVNVSFEPNPKAVQAQCEREGRMGVCGFADIKSCTCEKQQCVSHTTSAE